MSLQRKQVDFFYWHAVSKMRMADFEGASTIFALLQTDQPARNDVSLGRIYCLMRQGELAAAAGAVAAMRRRPLPPDEMALLGRLHRRCEFEQARSGTRQRLLARAASAATADAVAMPHTLGDDTMARRAAERGH